MSYLQISLGENEVEVARLLVESFVIPEALVKNQRKTEIVLTNRRLVASAPERFFRSTDQARIAVPLVQIAGVRLASRLQGFRILRLVFWLVVLAGLAVYFATLGLSALWNWAVSSIGRFALFIGMVFGWVFFAADVFLLFRNARQTQIVISTTGGATYRLPVSRYEIARVERFIDAFTDAPTDSSDNS